MLFTTPLETSPLSSLEKKQSLILKSGWRRILGSGNGPDEDLNECRPDYILEYFEGKAYVERERLMEDPQWMAFVRERAGSEFVLDYQVILHRVPERQP